MRRGILTLTASNLASKPLGLLRQLAFATFYGVTAVMSACRFAQTITMAFMNFFTTDTLNAGFLPLYQRYKEESPALAHCFFWCLFALISLLALSVSLLLYFGASWVVHIFAPGFHSEVAWQAVQFIRVFAFAVPFCLLGTLFSYLAMNDDAYLGVATRPMFESIGLILGVLVSIWSQQYQAIAWGFVFAYVLFFVFVFSVCLKRRLLHRVPLAVFKMHAPRLGGVFWHTVRPLLILPFFMQGKFVVEKMVASLIAVSAVASLDYARFIIETGINVIATPIGLVGLTAFSLLDGDKLSEKLQPIMNLLLLISFPITLFLVINSQLIITVLYGYGAFDAAAIKQASVILAGMSVAFFAQVMAYVLIKVLSAKLKNRRVMYYMVAALLVNIVFIVISWRWLGVMALGLGESLYALTLFTLCASHFKLFASLKSLMHYLLPAALMYLLLASYLGTQTSIVPWFNIIEQGMFFATFWGLVLFGFAKTRALIKGVV